MHSKLFIEYKIVQEQVSVVKYILLLFRYKL